MRHPDISEMVLKLDDYRKVSYLTQAISLPEAVPVLVCVSNNAAATYAGCHPARRRQICGRHSKPQSRTLSSLSLSLYLSERVSQHVFSAHTHNFSQSSQEIEKLRPIVPKVDPTPAPVYQHFSFLSLYPSSLSLLISYTFTAA
jgi:hypothetical protein